MNTKQKVFNLLKENKKRELSKKVNLSVIQNIITEFDAFEEAESSTSYFAYEYGDEVIDAYDEFRMKYDVDNYVVNGAMRNLPDTTDVLRDNLAELQSAADNLGISPQEILDNSGTNIDFQELKNRVDSADDLFKEARDKMREISSYTGIPDFLN